MTFQKGWSIKFLEILASPAGYFQLQISFSVQEQTGSQEIQLYRGMFKDSVNVLLFPFSVTWASQGKPDHFTSAGLRQWLNVHIKF